MINTPLAISTTTLANWTVNTPGYSQAISTTGSTGPLTFAVTSGTVPTGLTLTPGGVLSGTPKSLGTYDFTVTATNTLANYTTLDDPNSYVATYPTGISGSNIVGFYLQQHRDPCFPLQRVYVDHLR